MDRSRDVGLVREKEEEGEEKRIYLRTREEYPDQEYRGRDIPPTLPLLLLLLIPSPPQCTQDRCLRVVLL